MGQGTAGLILPGKPGMCSANVAKQTGFGVGHHSSRVLSGKTREIAADPAGLRRFKDYWLMTINHGAIWTSSK
jgi:hypothetical protein